jgi:hypothetical protein
MRPLGPDEEPLPGEVKVVGAPDDLKRLQDRLMELQLAKKEKARAKRKRAKAARKRNRKKK